MARFRIARHPVRRVADSVVIDLILGHLAIRAPNGESISFMVDVIRDQGVYFPTNHSAAMDEFERLGFTLRKEHNKYGALLRTYVTI